MREHSDDSGGSDDKCPLLAKVSAAPGARIPALHEVEPGSLQVLWRLTHRYQITAV